MPSSGRPAAPSRRDDADELVLDPSTQGRELPVEAGEAGSLADEHHAAADAATFIASSETEPYAARRRPIASAHATAAVGIRP